MGMLVAVTSSVRVATFAPAGKTQTVLGPNDLGPANGAASPGTDSGRLGAWVLALPIAVLAAIALGAAVFVGSRALKQRSRIRQIERDLEA